MRALLLLAALALPGFARAEEAPLAVPIVIPGEIGKDACSTQGRLMGRADQGDQTIAVRNGPGDNEPFKEIDRLREAEPVLVCERLGGWSGIVYGSDLPSCRTTAVLPVTREYVGPCQRGWVSSRFISTDAP
ncbi:integron [Methylobacterium sp. WL116]|uniref:integron n=1 Tax=Methylobacterium sp. WL116 TaxID=2603889 RepID=UPI0011CA427B|nr:integron [Methylobacterium sp. WL116]TXM91177.1 integron [Methylobacterium sp. WL116]